MYFSFCNTVSSVLVTMHDREEEVSCGAVMHENKLSDGGAYRTPVGEFSLLGGPVCIQVRAARLPVSCSVQPLA